MGFYNFYFIKQILNYLRRNKKFIIFFIILLLLLFIRSTCFAVGLRSFSFTYNNQTTDVTLPNESKYNYIIFWTADSSQADNGQFRFYCSSQPLKFKWLYSTYDGYLRLTAENNSTIYYGTFYNSRYTDPSKRNTFTTSNQSVQWDRGINDYIASNDDIPIYNYNNVLVDSYAGALPPESYANLPYFLNSVDDIALGEQDLIIMPR